MTKQVFKGFKQVNGTVSGFTTDDFEDGYLYFVRTDEEKEDGYMYFNGKKYGQVPDIIDCGTY